MSAKEAELFLALAERIEASQPILMIGATECPDVLLIPKEWQAIVAGLRRLAAGFGYEPPAAWRVWCTNNGATGYLYTEALPFELNPGFVVWREPEPLFTSPAASAPEGLDTP